MGIIKKVLFLLALSTVNCIVAQEEHNDIIAGVTDFFEFEIGRKSTDTNHYRTKFVIAPVMAYEPSTSLELGVGSKLLFKFKNSTPETRTSNLPVSITYTLKNQFIISTEYTLFTNEEKFLIKGAAKYLKFPFTYYGEGNLTRETDKIHIGLKNLLFEPLLLKRVHKKLFIGGGLRYNSIWDVKELGEKHASDEFINSVGSLSSGVEFATTYDSRDNVLNAHHGHFIELTNGFYGKYLGGDNQFSITKLNARMYIQLNKKKLDVLAFEFYSRFTGGNTPIFELSSLGGKELLRGFQERRFNAKHALFLQTEYRWQAFERFGFVFYTGAGDVISNFEKDFKAENFKYTLGTGIRLKIVKSENLNIRLDYALGLGKFRDNNFYLGIAEAF